MKRLLFVTESLGRGGMEHVLADIANALAEKNYSITILLYADRMELSNELDPKIRLIYKERRAFKLMRKLPYIHRFYKKDKWEKRASPRQLYRYYVGREKYDVEVGFYRGPSIKIISGSPNRRSKKLAWVHTDFKLCDPKSITRFFNDMDEVKTAYSSFDNVVCVSKEAGKSFREVIGLTEDKIRVIYNMVCADKILERSREACPLQKRRFTIVTVGRLIPDKGYDRLINAAARLNDEGYRFDLWIVGGGRSEEYLKEYAENKHTDNVIFTGMQDNPYKYLKCADLFVCSSLREGFSLAVAEALTLGIPAVSTRCTGPTEILADGQYGVLVDNSEDGIFQGLKNALDGLYDLKYMAEKARQRAVFFDSSTIAEDIVGLIE